MKKSAHKIRVDQLLFQRGLVPSRQRAQALLLAGKVLVEGQKVVKSGTTVDSEAEIRLLEPDLKYVSRGGLKLEHALEHWQIDVRGKICRSEEHTSELQSHSDLVCRLLLEKKKQTTEK